MSCLFYIVQNESTGSFSLRLRNPETGQDAFVRALPQPLDEAKKEAEKWSMGLEVQVHLDGWKEASPEDIAKAEREKQEAIAQKKKSAERGMFKTAREMAKFDEEAVKEQEPFGDTVPDDFLVGWGKHRGKKMSELPQSYLRWMLNEWMGGDEPVKEWQKFPLRWAYRKLYGRDLSI